MVAELGVKNNPKAGSLADHDATSPANAEPAVGLMSMPHSWTVVAKGAVVVTGSPQSPGGSAPVSATVAVEVPETVTSLPVVDASVAVTVIVRVPVVAYVWASVMDVSPRVPITPLPNVVVVPSPQSIVPLLTPTAN